MVLAVLQAVASAGISQLSVVVGSGAERVIKTLQDTTAGGVFARANVSFVEQPRQRGTGDAASVGLTALDELDYLGDDNDHVLVVHGDLPLITEHVVRETLEHHLDTGAAATVLSVPSGPGTTLRSRLVFADDGERVLGVQAEGDSDECAAGVYVFRRSLLAPAIRRTSPENYRGEYDLNDVVAVLADAGHTVSSWCTGDPDAVRSVNTRADLAEAEALLRDRINRAWMQAGVTITDPLRTYIDAAVVLGTGIILWPGTILSGCTVIGDNAELGPDTHLTDCAVGTDAVVVRTTGRDAEIGPGSTVGPFVVLEPGAQIAPNSVTGSFVTATSSE